MPVRHVPCAPAQELEAAPQSRQHGLGREELDARRGQFDGQRQAVQADADLGHRRGVGVVHPEVGLDRQGALDEERHGGILRQGLDGRQVPGIGQVERGHRELVLAAEPQHHPAGHQALQARAGRQQLRHQRGRRHDLLEVVEHQQHLLILQELLQALEQHLARFFLDAQRPGDAGGHQRGVPDGRQRDKVDPVLKVLEQVGGHLQAQAGLAGAAGTGEGQQTHLRTPQEFARRRRLPAPAR